MFGRATITLGIGPHSGCHLIHQKCTVHVFSNFKWLCKKALSMYDTTPGFKRAWIVCLDQVTVVNILTVVGCAYTLQFQRLAFPSICVWGLLVKRPQCAIYWNIYQHGLGFKHQYGHIICDRIIIAHALRLISLTCKRVWQCPLWSVTVTAPHVPTL